MSRPLLAFLALSFLAPAVRAELPPGSYDELRTGAQEAVIVVVESVRTSPRGGRIDVAVEARVVAVERSKSGLKKGGRLTIRYDTPARGAEMPGPRPVPVLEKGEAYPAFLNGGKDGFEPAAHGMSFVMTPER